MHEKAYLYTTNERKRSVCITFAIKITDNAAFPRIFSRNIGVKGPTPKKVKKNKKKARAAKVK